MILERKSFIYGDIVRSVYEVEHNAIFCFKNSFLEQIYIGVRFMHL